MKRITLSKVARCAAERYCFPVNGSRERRQEWIDANDLFVDSRGRAFALVDTATEVYFMDAITGSLYQFGMCLSSSYLHGTSIVRDRKAAQTFLMSQREAKEVAEEVEE